jgi:hypothetical protein
MTQSTTNILHNISFVQRFHCAVKLFRKCHSKHYMSCRAFAGAFAWQLLMFYQSMLFGIGRQPDHRFPK